MRVNNKIELLQKRLQEEVQKLEDNFLEGFKKSLSKYPIHTFCSVKDLEKLIKDIWENKEQNPIIVELLYEEVKKRKKNNNEIVSKTEENLDNQNEKIDS